MHTHSVYRPVSASAEVILRRQLEAAGLTNSDASWHPYSGGRTNAIWRVGTGAKALVCKLYSDAAGSPLFPNHAAAEAIALTALTGTGLAPVMIAEFSTPLGPCLVYRHVDGEPFATDVAAAAGLLARLHQQPAPRGLRHLQSGSAALLAQTDAILNDCRSVDAARLRRFRPQGNEPPATDTVFLHGDAVAANIISGPGGLTLIDWQCPALGDPTEDLAIFLSPAMQSLYGGRSLTKAEQARFLQGYGNAKVAARYQRLEPHYHWRMAAHCLWKSERGFPDYAAAMRLELAALDQF